MHPKLQLISLATGHKSRPSTRTSQLGSDTAKTALMPPSVTSKAGTWHVVGEVIPYSKSRRRNSTQRHEALTATTHSHRRPHAVGLDLGAEVSYQFLPEHWGRGYAREAVGAVVSWALREISPAPPVVVAVTREVNDRSRRLLESIGMTLIDSFVEFDAPQVMYSVDRAALRV